MNQNPTLKKLGILPASAFHASAALGADAATAPSTDASSNLPGSAPWKFFATLGAGMAIGFLLGRK